MKENKVQIKVTKELTEESCHFLLRLWGCFSDMVASESKPHNEKLHCRG